MENQEIQKANNKIERAVNQLELILLDIKIAHSKIKIEMFNDCYQFLLQEMEYEKRIQDLEKELKYIKNDKNQYTIDVKVE